MMLALVVVRRCHAEHKNLLRKHAFKRRGRLTGGFLYLPSFSSSTKEIIF
jgi:hypothetical protein